MNGLILEAISIIIAFFVVWTLAIILILKNASHNTQVNPFLHLDKEANVKIKKSASLFLLLIASFIPLLYPILNNLIGKKYKSNIQRMHPANKTIIDVVAAEGFVLFAFILFSFINDSSDNLIKTYIKLGLGTLLIFINAALPFITYMFTDLGMNRL